MMATCAENILTLATADLFMLLLYHYENLLIWPVPTDNGGDWWGNPVVKKVSYTVERRLLIIFLTIDLPMN